jgi:hypothetical protein
MAGTAPAAAPRNFLRSIAGPFAAKDDFATARNQAGGFEPGEGLGAGFFIVELDTPMHMST